MADLHAAVMSDWLCVALLLAHAAMTTAASAIKVMIITLPDILNVCQVNAPTFCDNHHALLRERDTVGIAASLRHRGRIECGRRRASQAHGACRCLLPCRHAPI